MITTTVRVETNISKVEFVRQDVSPGWVYINVYKDNSDGFNQVMISYGDFQKLRQGLETL